MNETSDAGLLYPYLSGDTIGGNLRSETYRFSGGYARRYRSFSWGLAAAFRATQEYRAVDPRPANIASDLRVSAGFAFYPCTDYVLGGAVHLQKYKQKNEIDFYNELGDVKIFHYTGLGMDYARFRTKADRTYYIGQGAGASLNLKPRHVAGFSATMDYSYSGFEKIIASLNELNMLELADRSATAEAGYRTEGKGFFRAFRLNGYLRQRAGNENIFGNESSNNYPYIASIWQYRHRLAGVEAAALCEYRSNGNTVWEAQPAAGYDTETEQYLYPARKISFDAATLSLRLAATVTKGRCAFRTQAFVRHRMPIESSMDVSGNGNENDNYSLPALLHNFASRSGRQTLLALDERFDFAFRDNYALFLQCRWQYGEYVNRIRSNYFTFSCGINF
jgi:hypothetical protein